MKVQSTEANAVGRSPTLLVHRDSQSLQWDLQRASSMYGSVHDNKKANNSTQPNPCIRVSCLASASVSLFSKLHGWMGTGPKQTSSGQRPLGSKKGSSAGLTFMDLRISVKRSGRFGAIGPFLATV